MSMLGDALTGQGRFTEAEPLLLKALEGLGKHSNKTAAEETRSRLVRLYEKLDRPEDAAHWRAQ